MGWKTNRYKSIIIDRTIIMSNTKHIWEGWTVQDFIDDLEISFGYKRFDTKAELKNWCKSEQPYYKKHIPEVYRHFLNKTEL
jgi:hypothetical protein